MEPFRPESCRALRNPGAGCVPAPHRPRPAEGRAGAERAPFRKEARLFGGRKGSALLRLASLASCPSASERVHDDGVVLTDKQRSRNGAAAWRWQTPGTVPAGRHSAGPGRSATPSIDRDYSAKSAPTLCGTLSCAQSRAGARAPRGDDTYD